ncbi:MAG: NUDIX hydrolase [Rhodospirillales bacterium]|nr:NUDIX hydrolase [Rhodospirillales bacterium]
MLPETRNGEIVLVEQFRPCLETRTLELPGGLLEPGEEPAASVARELEEETGYRVGGELTFLGKLYPDTGRLENRLWCFHATGVEPVPDWRPEPGMTPHLMTKAEFKAAIMSGRFAAALHVAIVGLAALHNRF